MEIKHKGHLLLIFLGSYLLIPVIYRIFGIKDLMSYMAINPVTPP